MKLKLWFAGFCLLTFVLGPKAWAEESKLLSTLQDLQKQMGAMHTQMGRMQQTIDWQNGVLKDLQNDRREVKGPSKVEVPANFKENLKASIGDADQWLKGLKFSGDLRLRYEGISESSGGLTSGVSADSDRNRFRYRLRYGFEKTFNDELKVGFRLGSGDPGSIGTRNQTFDSQFGLKNIGIDRAYATYTPKWAQVGPVKKLEVTGGKFKNPFEEGSTRIVWDHDVTPEGAYEKIELGLLQSETMDIDASFMTGQFIIEEGAGPASSDDAELFAYQGGFRSTLKGVMDHPVFLKNLISFYDYKEITSPGNFGGITNGNFTDNGGLSAEDFKLIDIYNEIGFQIDPLPKTKVFFEWVKNIDESATPPLGGGQDKAWNLGLQLGSMKKKGTWQLSYEYVWVEANAVPGVFNDGTYGYSDSRGSILKAKYALTDYLLFKSTVFLRNRITGGGLTADEETRGIQLDMVWKI